MPLVDTVARTLQIKIVYYGPGLSGKTTTLETLAKQMDPSRRGDLMVLDTTGDRTLFFDWMPVELGKIRGFDVKIQLYTVPGQVRYNNTRRQVLAGVDGLVFVADSQRDATDQNKFSFMNLRENLAEQGIDLEDLPLVVQYNKQDLPNALPGSELAPRLNFEQYPHTETVAATGEGVVETLRLVTRVTLQSVKATLDPSNGTVSYQASPVPMDGEGLLEHIMSAELPSETAGPGLETDDDATDGSDSPYAEITAEIGEDEREAAASPASPLASKLEEIEQRLDETRRSVNTMREQRVSEQRQGDEKLGALEQRSEELASRLEVAQRVLSSMGGRMAVVERRISRMEMADQQSRRAEELRELGQLLARVAEVLDGHATTLQTEKLDKDRLDGEEGRAEYDERGAPENGQQSSTAPTQREDEGAAPFRPELAQDRTEEG